jgi:hypothetical protein
MNAQDISANANDISLSPAATEGHSKLCDIWPTVKEGLQILEEALKNPVLKVIIGTIIAAGDAIVGKICGS